MSTETFLALTHLHDITPNWHSELPTRHHLLRSSFGKPTITHSFTQEASFDTIAFNIFKSGFLDFPSFLHLRSSHPLLEHLSNMIVALATVDFRPLREPDPTWASIKEVPRHANLQFLALLFHYDCHLSAAVRFLGKKFLGGHRDVSSIVPKLRPHVDSETIAAFTRVMTQGCPAHFNYESTRKNAMDYLRHGNSPSVNQHEDLVSKALVKEYRNNYAIPLPSWAARYIRHVFFTPIHILQHRDKPPRIVFDALKLHYPSSVSVNNMTSTKNGCEMDCAYGDVMLRLLTRIWNLRISFPRMDIILHCNDVKSCFRYVYTSPSTSIFASVSCLH